MNNNKSKTWMKTMRVINKGREEDWWYDKAVHMSTEEWEVVTTNLESALEVLRVVSPRSVERATKMNDEYCANDQPGTALFLANSMILLAAVIGDKSLIQLESE